MYHCAGIVNSNAVVPLSKGVGFTVSKTSAGVYIITFNTAHPSTPYLESATSAVSGRIISYSIQSSTSVRINTLSFDNIATDTGFNIYFFVF